MDVLRSRIYFRRPSAANRDVRTLLVQLRTALRLRGAYGFGIRDLEVDHDAYRECQDYARADEDEADPASIHV